MLPAHLPRSEDELPAWRIYADALLSAGDPLGELLAIELALPVGPNALELMQFHLAAQRRCRAFASLDVGWCLGHARTVAVVDPEPGPEVVDRLVEHLVELGTFLSRPVARLVESVEVKLKPEMILPLSMALQRAPPTCSRLVLFADGEWEPQQVDELIHALPPPLRRIRLLGGDPLHFLRPGLVELDVRYCRGQFWGSIGGIRQAVEAAAQVRLISGNIAVTKVVKAEACLAGDAGLLEPDDRILTVLPPLPLAQLQRRHGIITVLAQLRRSVPELHPAWRPGGPAFVRSEGGAWKVRADGFAAEVDGAEIAVGTSAPVVTGNRVRYYGQHRVFLEDASLWRSYCASA